MKTKKAKPKLPDSATVCGVFDVLKGVTSYEVWNKGSVIGTGRTLAEAKRDAIRNLALSPEL